MKDTIKSPSIDTGIDITKMHGHMNIYLTDVKTGKVEEVHEDNMMTNALQEYFRNCGFLNYPNVNQNNMVVELLGGVMGFSEEISENASIIHVPAGNKMVFNGSVGTVNNGNPTELGSLSETESGWQSDGSYVQTYDFSTSQANGTISCVCLTGRNFAYAGEGNSTSLVRHATKENITNLCGATETYSLLGTAFNYNHSASTVHTFAIETRTDAQTEETYRIGVLRCYRVPISKINIKGTTSDPILLSENEITFDEDFQNSYGGNRTIKSESYDGNLYLWNVHTYDGEEWKPLVEWGNTWTQYLWKLTSSGNLTKQTLLNTSGETLYGLQAAHFDGDYIFFMQAFGANSSYANAYIDTRYIYVLNRNNGTIQKITNAEGSELVVGNGVGWYDRYAQAGWNIHHCSGDGRIYTSGNYPIVVDAVNMECYPTNASGATLGNLPIESAPLIRSNGANLYRDQGYIASINNLDTPVVKTAEKTMKVIYRITFDEQ